MTGNEGPGVLHLGLPLHPGLGQVAGLGGDADQQPEDELGRKGNGKTEQPAEQH